MQLMFYMFVLLDFRLPLRFLHVLLLISLWLFENYYKLFFGFFCAVISELIHYSAAGSSSGLPVHMPLIQVIVPQVMNLKAQLRDSSKVLLHQILHLSFL